MCFYYYNLLLIIQLAVKEKVYVKSVQELIGHFHFIYYNPSNVLIFQLAQR